MIPVGNCTIPPNKEVPAAGVVEIRYLYAYEGGSLYQPTYIGVRDDLIVADCLITQLKYKGVTTARTLQATASKPNARKLIF
jgi:bifunctional non-homologous end joining protein LigD